MFFFGHLITHQIKARVAFAPLDEAPQTVMRRSHHFQTPHRGARCTVINLRVSAKVEQ